MKCFLDLADFSHDAVIDMLALAAPPEGQAGADCPRRPHARPDVLRSLAAHARLHAGRDGRARRQLVRHHARQRELGARDGGRRRDERQGREHIREGDSRPCLVLRRPRRARLRGGSRPCGRSRRADVHQDRSALRQAARQPRIRDEPSLPGARGLEDARRPRRAAGAASSCCPGRITRARFRSPCRPPPHTWRRCAAWKSSCCGPRAMPCPSRS